MKYIQELIERILNFSVDDIIDIEDPQKEGDVVLGDVPIELQKLYSYRKLKIEEHNILVQEFRNKKWKDREEKKKGTEEFRPTLRPLKEEIDLLEKMLWISLRKEFNCLEMLLAIRKGWKLVAPKKEGDDIFSHHGIIVVSSGFPFPFPGQ
jgi:hypothetical protein